MERRRHKKSEQHNSSQPEARPSKPQNRIGQNSEKESKQDTRKKALAIRFSHASFRSLSFWLVGWLVGLLLFSLLSRFFASVPRACSLACTRSSVFTNRLSGKPTDARFVCLSVSRHPLLSAVVDYY
jgi:hypothetical protein